MIIPPATILLLVGVASLGVGILIYLVYAAAARRAHTGRCEKLIMWSLRNEASPISC